MPEGTLGGDLIGITGRVVGGRRGGNLLLQACFHKLCTIYTQSHRLSLQGIFFWFLCNAGIYFQYVPCMNYFLFF